MTYDELLQQKCPFVVQRIYDSQTAIVTGFSKGMFPLAGLTHVYFQGGGWLLVCDLITHYKLPQNEDTAVTGGSDV